MREGRARGRRAPRARRSSSGVRELLRGAQARRGGRLPARPGARRGRGRMGGVLRQAGLHHDARRQARRAPRASRASSPTRGACRAAEATRSCCGRLPETLPGESATARLNRAIEALVRECPGQYLWGYNRYKTPRGAEAHAAMITASSLGSCGCCSFLPLERAWRGGQRRRRRPVLADRRAAQGDRASTSRSAFRSMPATERERLARAHFRAFCRALRRARRCCGGRRASASSSWCASRASSTCARSTASRSSCSRRISSASTRRCSACRSSSRCR